MRLEDKVAIVTGASQGIGESIAKRYAKEGAKVAVNYSKSEDKANKVVADIKSGGGEAKAFKADCSKVKEIEGLVNRVIEIYGTVDIVVNNAGVFRNLAEMLLRAWRALEFSHGQDPKRTSAASRVAVAKPVSALPKTLKLRATSA